MARVFAVALFALAAAACSSTAAIPDPSAGEGPGIAIACLGLEQPDCMRAYDAAATGLAPDVQVTYAEVGPFGCPNEPGCPRSLAFRPSGQVVFEGSNGEPILILMSAATANIAISPGDFFGVSVAPTSTSGQLRAEPIAYSLGHCGLMSGIDIDGSWWDPVGFVDVDHPDAINAANGTFTPHDPNHATFVSDGGLEVSLVRRVGEKQLPGCM